MNEKEKSLSEKIGKMKRNRESVPKELLEGKYAGAYQRLQEEIKSEIRSLAFDALAGVQVEYSSAESVLRALEKTYEEGGYGIRLGKAAFIDMDAGAVLSIVEEIRTAFVRVLHTIADTIPGMVRFCGPVSGPASAA